MAKFPTPAHDHGVCADRAVRVARNLCRRRGLRLTSQREKVLDVLAQSHQPMGAYEILEKMTEDGKRPAPITVYRALDFLVGQGLAHRIESRNAFVACSRLHEAGRAVLMVCERCGTVDELEAASVFDGLDVLSSAEGFETRRAVIELSGCCAPCRDIEE